MRITFITIISLIILSIASCVEKTQNMVGSVKNKITQAETSSEEDPTIPFIQSKRVQSHFVQNDSVLFRDATNKRSLFASGKGVGDEDYVVKEMTLLDLSVNHYRAQRFLQNIVDDMQDKAWPGFKHKFRVQLWNESSYNAAAVIEGDESVIQIHTGVLMQDDLSDAEIAGLLAHEMAHHYLGHKKRSAITEYFRNNAALLSLMVMSHRAKEKQEKSGRDLTKQESNQLLAEAQMNLLIASKAAAALVNAPWSRKQEYEADRLAVDLIIASGYSYRGVQSFISRFNDPELSGERFIKELVDTGTQVINETAQTKVRGSVDVSASQDPSSASSLVDANGDVNKTEVKNRLNNSMLKFLIAAGDELHARPHERSREINLYLNSIPEYKALKKNKIHRKIAVSNIDQLVEGTHIQQWAKELADLTNAWIAYSHDNEDRESLKKIKEYSGHELDSLGKYMHFNMVLEKKIEGDLKAETLKIENWGGKYPFVYNNVANKLMDYGHVELAFKVVKAAQKNVGLSTMWPSLYRYYSLTEKNDLAKETLQQCILDGNPDAQKACVYIAPKEDLAEVKDLTLKFVDRIQSSVDDMTTMLRQ